jgi:CRISPR-associated protein Cmr1
MKRNSVCFKTITPLWLGNKNGRNIQTRETGIIGSLRWWYEAVIRGFGGYACDPTQIQSKCTYDSLCDVCKLFGCTGLARKFRLEINKNNSDFIIDFIELKKIFDIELSVLNKTIKIIEEFGALGGKIAESDYGLIKITNNDLKDFKINKKELENYLKKRRRNDEKLPAIDKFFFVKKGQQKLKVKLKDEISSLKGSKKEAKRYFYKSKNGKFNRLFTYAINENEYTKIKNFFTENKINFIEGKNLMKV